MNKRVHLLSVLLLPAFAVAAPFCVFEPSSGTTNCWYYNMQSCRQAAGTSGACVVNPNEVRPNGGFSQTPPINQRPPLKYIETNPVTDAIQRNKLEAEKHRAEEQENELRELEIEQRRRDLDRQQKAPAPAGDTGDLKKSQPEHDAPLTMVCDMRTGWQHTVTVDIVNQTVDGKQARISNSHIEWEEERKGRKIQWSINRFIGSVTVEGLGSSAQGKCEAFSQADRKF